MSDGMNGKSMRKLWFAILGVWSVALLAGCAAARTETAVPAKQAAVAGKYILYFIGDGMGHEHVELAKQQLGKDAEAFDRVPLVGHLQTDNAAGKTTDSAAAGTALACGVKTANGFLGMTPEKQSVDSIMVAARKAGRKTGVVTSVPVNHATPAAFYAHVDARAKYDEIARQMAASGLDFIGGGRPILSKSLSSAELWRQMVDQGYTVSDSVTAATIGRETPGGKRLVCHDWDYYAIDRDAVNAAMRPDLADYTCTAIAELDNPNGFVLMVEGGRIDYAAHQDDGAAMLEELREFNRAIETGLDFYRRHPEETIVVVTADHNTGGLHFTGPVPAAYGKTAPRISFERLLRELRRADMTKWESVPEALEKLKIALSPEERKLAKAAFDRTGKDRRADAVARALLQERDRQSNIAWKSGSHTSDDVDLRVLGAGTESIAGTMPNSELVLKLKKAGGLE